MEHKKERVSSILRRRQVQVSVACHSRLAFLLIISKKRIDGITTKMQLKESVSAHLVPRNISSDEEGDSGSSSGCYGNHDGARDASENESSGHRERDGCKVQRHTRVSDDAHF